VDIGPSETWIGPVENHWARSSGVLTLAYAGEATNLSPGPAPDPHVEMSSPRVLAPVGPNWLVIRLPLALRLCLNLGGVEESLHLVALSRGQVPVRFFGVLINRPDLLGQLLALFGMTDYSVSGWVSVVPTTACCCGVVPVYVPLRRAAVAVLVAQVPVVGP
jgi:hypothetical protein